MTNWAASAPPNDPEPEGWLLYAAVDGDFDYCYELVKRRIRACSINLSQSWQEIETALRKLVDGEDRIGEAPLEWLTLTEDA